MSVSQVAQPVELVGAAPEIDVTGRAVRRDFRYDSHGFTASLFWSPFLVKANLANATLGLWDLHLDTADARWAAHVAEFDYVVLSDTNWFLRPSVYYEGGRAVGRNGAAPSPTRPRSPCPAPCAPRSARRSAARRGAGDIPRQGDPPVGHPRALRERRVEHRRRLRPHPPVPARRARPGRRRGRVPRRAGDKNLNTPFCIFQDSYRTLRFSNRKC